MSDEFGIKNLIPGSIRALSVLEENRIRGESVLSFGVTFLDRAIDGIIKSDIVLIGAPTGAGKTELVSNIARTNVSMGKKVFFFALESDENEIEARMIYSEAAAKFYADPKRPKSISPTFASFYLWKNMSGFEPYVKQAVEKMQKSLSDLFTIYRGSSSYDIRKFQNDFSKIKSDADLVIIDHLHYFDLESEKENVEYTKIIKAIRDLSLSTKVPIIVVAHLRKRDKSGIALMPDIDDFHGTSNIAKIATKAILIAPKFSQVVTDKWETYMRIVKYRVGGTRTRFVGLTKFNTLENCYLNEFDLGVIRIEKGKEEFAIFEKEDYPSWARSLEPWKPKPQIEAPRDFTTRIDF